MKSQDCMDYWNLNVKEEGQQQKNTRRTARTRSGKNIHIGKRLIIRTHWRADWISIRLAPRQCSRNYEISDA